MISINMQIFWPTVLFKRSKWRIRQRYRHPENFLVFHNSTTLKHVLLRLILSFVAITGYALWTQEIGQAYIQSYEPLRHPIYLKPSKALSLPERVFRELLKPLYGIYVSGDYWINTFKNNSTRDLKMITMPTDGAVFLSSITTYLGVLFMLVNYLIACGDEKFCQLADETKKRFEEKN